MTDKITVFNSKEFLKTAPIAPGVYRMFDADNTIIYVGKAKNLKNRLSSYFRKNLDSKKTENLVKHIHNIELTVTQTETEALILEHNYIKRYQPKYNVLLRDDKSYPYIFLSDERHPRISLFRGAKNKKGEYFGPYPNQSAVRETLNLLQKLFPIRQCEDSVYRNRQRPCLQYQIKRCLGPCVDGLVSEQEYQENVNYIRLFLSGKDEQVIQHLVKRMEEASIKLEFERAAKLRDLIQSIRHITAQQSVDGNLHDLDVIGFAHKSNIASLHILFIRQGKVLGSRNYFPKIPLNTDKQEIIETFIGQFYLEGNQARTLPQEIILDANLKNGHFITEVLTQFAGRKITIHCQVRGEKARYAKLATLNAKSALVSKLMQQSTTEQRFIELEQALSIPSIQRMECFDISHHQGEQTVASCVVFDREGPSRSQYRRYLINGITPGDDYAAMKQVLTRRYTKSLPEDKIPDVIFIDGGKGQLAQAIRVFDTLDVDWDKNKPLLLGIAKGEERKAGLETLFFEPVGNGVNLPSNSLALHLIQHIRDEAHDHAISGHRKRLVKVKTHSTLEDIEGIGPKRRQQLLKHMGGLKPLMQASAEEIAKVPGISLKLAQKIHDALKH